jgi:hypothetical protein
MGQAVDKTQPIADLAGSNAADSRNSANQSLGTASNTLSNSAAPTLSGAGSAYQNMADTGGFSDADKSAYLNRATESATAAGNVASDQSKLAAAKTGQGNPQAAISRIARQMGQNASQATNDAQAGLTSQINSNKLAGAGGLTNVGQAQTSLGNAQTNIGQTQANMSNQSAQQQLSALGLQFNSEEEAQQALDSLSHNPGIFDNIMRVGSAAAGAAAGLGVRV